MRRCVVAVMLALAVGALLYLPGTVLWGWPHAALAVAALTPWALYVVFVALEFAAAAHRPRNPGT